MSTLHSTEFKQRCKGLGIQGVTLHSYRYGWAERARKAYFHRLHWTMEVMPSR
jgi:acyl-CoA thioesterase FadM